MSARLSRQPRPTSWAHRNKLLPPSCITADPKLTRVGSDGLSNTSATTRRPSGVGASRRGSAFSRAASSRIWFNSSRETSVMSVKCRMVLLLQGEDGFLEDGNAFRKHVVGQVEGGQQADDGLVRAVDEQPPLQAALDDVRAGDS